MILPQICVSDLVSLLHGLHRLHASCFSLNCFLLVFAASVLGTKLWSLVVTDPSAHRAVLWVTHRVEDYWSRHCEESAVVVQWEQFVSLVAFRWEFYESHWWGLPLSLPCSEGRRKPWLYDHQTKYGNRVVLLHLQWYSSLTVGNVTTTHEFVSATNCELYDLRLGNPHMVTTLVWCGRYSCSDWELPLVTHSVTHAVHYTNKAHTLGTWSNACRNTPLRHYTAGLWTYQAIVNMGAVAGDYSITLGWTTRKLDYRHTQNGSGRAVDSIKQCFEQN